MKVGAKTWGAGWLDRFKRGTKKTFKEGVSGQVSRSCAGEGARAVLPPDVRAGRRVRGEGVSMGRHDVSPSGAKTLAAGEANDTARDGDEDAADETDNSIPGMKSFVLAAMDMRTTAYGTAHRCLSVLANAGTGGEGGHDGRRDDARRGGRAERRDGDYGFI